MVLSVEDLALQDFINGHSLDREATQLLLGSLLDGFSFLKYISIRFQIIIRFGYLFVYQAKCLKLLILTLIETRLHLILGQVGMSSGNYLLLRETNFLCRNFFMGDYLPMLVSMLWIWVLQCLANFVILL